MNCLDLEILLPALSASVFKTLSRSARRLLSFLENLELLKRLNPIQYARLPCGHFLDQLLSIKIDLEMDVAPPGSDCPDAVSVPSQYKLKTLFEETESSEKSSSAELQKKFLQFVELFLTEFPAEEAELQQISSLFRDTQNRTGITSTLPTTVSSEVHTASVPGCRNTDSEAVTEVPFPILEGSLKETYDELTLRQPRNHQTTTSQIYSAITFRKGKAVDRRLSTVKIFYKMIFLFCKLFLHRYRPANSWWM